MRIFDVFKPRVPVRPITARVAAEIIGHEAIVRECYKDSEGVWTWGVGVTNKSGHRVYPRYLDKPQPIEHCIGVYLWLLEKMYLPDVLAAFKGREMAEHELAAALSFHWNTGAILKADWVRDVLAGDLSAGRLSIMNYRKPTSIIERRRKERDLFFDGTWTNNGKTTVWPVRKPSYSPDWGNGVRTNIAPILAELLP